MGEYDDIKEKKESLFTGEAKRKASKGRSGARCLIGAKCRAEIQITTTKDEIT
mgnify:CR=1 FL=1